MTHNWMRALVAGLAVSLAGVSQTAYANATPQNEDAFGCPPTIVALPMPSGMDHGDILGALGHRAVGFVGDASGHQHVAVWTRFDERWHVRDLGDFGITAPGEPLSATGVDGRGEVAVGINSDVMAGWLVSGGRVHQLTDFAGATNAYVRAINASGEMVGEALDADGNDFAAVWAHWWSRPQRLAPVAGYDGSYAQGVSDLGQVTGGSFSFGPAPTVATVWSARGRAAALPSGQPAEGFAINNSGQVAGRTLLDPRTALVWPRTGPPHSPNLFAGDTFARGLAITARGEVAGFEGSDPAGAIPIRHVLLSFGMQPTRSLLPLSLSWADNALTHVIADNDTVYGSSALTHTSFPRPTIWTCTSQQSFVPPNNGGQPTGYTSPRVVLSR
ncbi:MAG: hypothetical protein M3070_10060 [Actinomycetota bacterium]|nr:hypothetical protein [Actinomycetota bacterium]